MVCSPSFPSFPRSIIKLSLFGARKSLKSGKEDRLSPGRCPHCRLQFIDPVALSCGHSLCSSCCQELLRKELLMLTKYEDVLLDQCSPTMSPPASEPPSPDSSTPPLPPKRRDSVDKTPPRPAKTRHLRTPMMGVRTIRMVGELLQHVNGDVNVSGSPFRVPLISYTTLRQPTCIVCGAAATTQPPIRNHALTQLLRVLSRRQSKRKSTLAALPEHVPPVQPSIPHSYFSTSSGVCDGDTEVGVRKRNVAVLGAPGTGKTQLARAQFLNSLFFAEIGHNVVPAVDFDRLPAKYMLNIIDEEQDGGICSPQALLQSHAFVLLFSFTDAGSLKYVEELATAIKSARQDNPPIVIVGGKSDLTSERKVSAEEGDQLAQRLNCSFLEVSAKENAGVSELFIHILQDISYRRSSSQPSDSDQRNNSSEVL